MKQQKQKQSQQATGGARKKKLYPMPSVLLHKFIQLRKLYATRKSISVSEEVIPYGWPDFNKGTQCPVFRLYLRQSQYIITGTASTAIALSLPIQASLLTNYGDLSLAFDEYRPLRGLVSYHSASQYPSSASSVGSNTLGVGCVDYINSAVPTAFDDVVGHDSHKYLQLCQTSGTHVDMQEGSGKWKLDFDPLPDQQWLNITASSTVFAYIKLYAPIAAVPSTATYGYLQGFVDLQFRGMSA